jgi:hypothetical protein
MHEGHFVSPGSRRANFLHFSQRIRVTPVDWHWLSSFIVAIVHFSGGQTQNR